jgi:RNA polymerase sigma factor (sigma-70 family)
MPSSQPRRLIEQLRRTVLLPDGAGLSDGQLLECFLTQGDDAAFAALVHRHGPMVWSVCRRILHDHHEAEDAFQATFLVLVRKAASVVPGDRVANWLYGVACQTAQRARVATAKRKAREKIVAEVPETAASGQDGGRDLRTLLDQELCRLPDKYRTPIVLCDLEGKTGKEAARQLGWPEGTVAGRLARGREMLAKRLTRQGLGLSSGALAVALMENAASGGVPASLMAATVKTTALLAAVSAATTGGITAEVAALTEGVIQTMFLKKLKLVTFAILTGVCLCTGTAVFTYTSRGEQKTGQQVAPAPRAGQPEERKGPDKFQVLLQKRRDALKEAIKDIMLRVESGQELLQPQMRHAQSMLTKVELALCKSDKERIKVLEDAVALAAKVERINKDRAEAGIKGYIPADLALAQADRLEAEYELEGEKARIASLR